MKIADIELVVLATIERIEKAERAWKTASVASGGSTKVISDARYKKEAAERDFAGQWRNVKLLLDHYRELEKSAQAVIEQHQRVSKKEANLEQERRSLMKRIDREGNREFD